MEMNFASIAQLWKADKRPYVKKSTYAIYCHLTNKYLIPRFGAETALKGDEVQEWVSQKLADGLSIKTMKDIALILRMIQKFGAQMGAWPSGELRVRFPRQTPPEGRAPSIFTREDERLLLEQLRGRPTPRNIGLWLCLTTGLRIGEICALRWADVDLLAGTVRICHTLQRVFLSDGDVREDILLLGTPKSAASAREIPLGGDLLSPHRPSHPAGTAELPGLLQAAVTADRASALSFPRPSAQLCDALHPKRLRLQNRVGPAGAFVHFYHAEPLCPPQPGRQTPLHLPCLQSTSPKKFLSLLKHFLSLSFVA